MTLTDANILVALADDKQPENTRCRAVFAAVRQPLITTWPAFAEAMYLLYRVGGWPLQRILWRLVQDSVLTFYDLNAAEQERARILMERYRNVPMDLADATLVAAAEALSLTQIFTLDSDFYVYRLHDTGAFEVIP